MPKAIPRSTIPELVAGKLSASIIEKQYLPGAYLPSERELIKELEVGRSSLREGLQILAEAFLKHNICTALIRLRRLRNGLMGILRRQNSKALKLNV